MVHKTLGTFTADAGRGIQAAASSLLKDLVHLRGAVQRLIGAAQSQCVGTHHHGDRHPMPSERDLIATKNTIEQFRQDRSRLAHGYGRRHVQNVQQCTLMYNRAS